MTQIVNIAESITWKYDLDKAIWEFEQEYGIRPRLYTNPRFAYRVVEFLQDIIWINDTGSLEESCRVGTYEEILIGFDTDIEDGVVILKA